MRRKLISKITEDFCPSHPSSKFMSHSLFSFVVVRLVCFYVWWRKITTILWRSKCPIVVVRSLSLSRWYKSYVCYVWKHFWLPVFMLVYIQRTKKYIKQAYLKICSRAQEREREATNEWVRRGVKNGWFVE